MRVRLSVPARLRGSEEPRLWMLARLAALVQTDIDELCS